MGGINYAKQLLCKTSTANLELTLRPYKCNISSCRKRCPLSLSIKTDHLLAFILDHLHDNLMFIDKYLSLLLTQKYFSTSWNISSGI